MVEAIKFNEPKSYNCSLVQDSSISSALVMEILQSYVNLCVAGKANQMP